ncbi:hypothetical protein F5883DRAFT_237812 [Diaporthe sp. PMI_573]|nr:hypothetical protein F5883DRAFT_237812 [Diaporthaceae sp. PMI_573]
MICSSWDITAQVMLLRHGVSLRTNSLKETIAMFHIFVSWVNCTLKYHAAITKEFVQPKQYEYVEESITRELYTHDVYHHVLPVIETELLPSKHFIESPDGCGLVEIREDEVQNHTVTGTGVYGQPNTEKPTESKIPHGRANLQLPENGSASNTHSFEDKGIYTTKEGIGRTEYLWRHLQSSKMLWA